MSLTRAQEKLIRSLHDKKGREESGLCLIEGEKNIEAAGEAVEFAFRREDTPGFNRLVTTETPQDVAAVAKIPVWSEDAIRHQPTIVVLDGVQDPGNVGAALRLCLGFHASLVLIESADPTSPKVIRASVGAMFQVPWREIARTQAEAYLADIGRPVYRLEKTPASQDISLLAKEAAVTLIAGSEGQGIHLPTEGQALAIRHDPRLESLNVGHALAIALHEREKRLNPTIPS